MRPSVVVPILAVLTLSAPMAHAQPAAPSVVASAFAANDATRAVDGFHQAISRGDLSAAAALIAEDAVIYEHGGVERTKGEYVSHHLPADAAYSKGLTDTVTARASRLSGDLAYVITDGRSTGSYEGKPVDSRTTETMILRRGEDGWRVVHIHWSSGKAPAG